MSLKLYFPESHGQIDYVGYNQAIRLFASAVGDSIVDEKAGADYRVYCNLPWHHDQKKMSCGLPVMAYTMYESTRVPPLWVRWLNRSVKVVLVPSVWCKKVFINSGVTRPIFVLNLCVDEQALPVIEKTIDTDKYVFMWQGVVLDLGGRKGADIAIRAFTELKDSGQLGNDASLIIKIRPNRTSKLEMDYLRTSNNVVFVQQDMPREQLLRLYGAVDCCINPTHGEGFGLIPLEQMAMGKPVIATNYSMQYLEPGCFIPIDYELKKSPVNWNHRFVQVNGNGITYNLTGLTKDIHWMPEIIKYRADHKSTSLYPPGFVPPKKNGLKLRFNYIVNRLSDYQRRLHFYYDPRRSGKSLYQEFQGCDAWASVDDLKSKMLWCYNNRDEAKKIGERASAFVRENWTLARMKNQWQQIESKIEYFKSEGSL